MNNVSLFDLHPSYPYTGKNESHQKVEDYINSKKDIINWKWLGSRNHKHKGKSTGGRLHFPKKYGKLSIQTHPLMLDDNNFCEIMWNSLNDKLSAKFKSDPQQFETLEKLVAYLEIIIQHVIDLEKY